jgi:hypothetical protein
MSATRAGWDPDDLKGGRGLVTACEVLLRDVVDVSNDNGKLGAQGTGGPCGAMIGKGNIAYKCMVS